MSLLDDVKIVCRVTSTAFDVELEALVAAAIADMKRVGIKEELLGEDNLHPLARVAIFAYAKAHFGYDVNERAEFEDTYRSAVIGLMNSNANSSSEDSDNGEV